MTNENIRGYCERLRLKSISKYWKEVEFKSKSQFLETLLKKEIEEKDTRRTNRLLGNAKFPYIKTFQDYKWDNITLPPNLLKQDILDLNFIEKKENLLLYGSIGTGKTHLAIATGIQACKFNKKVLYYSTQDLINELITRHRNKNLHSFFKKLDKIDLLIIDELGYVPFHKDGANLLFQVVSRCYERRSIIITTNLEFGKWSTIFGDNNLTKAMIDRLIHHAQVMIFEGESYRLKQSMLGENKKEKLEK